MRQWLKEAREKLNMSQQDVATKINITRQYYQQIEAGDRQQKMDITLMTKLSDCLGVPITDIVEHERAAT